MHHVFSQLGEQGQRHSTIDIHGRSQNLRHLFDSGMGLKLGVFGFSPYQNNCDLPGAYVTCIYCFLSEKINLRKMGHGTRRSWSHLFCVCFCVCNRQKTRRPQFEPHVWWCHYTRRYRRSGISRVYLWTAGISYKLIMRISYARVHGCSCSEGTCHCLNSKTSFAWNWMVCLYEHQHYTPVKLNVVIKSILL